MQERWTEVDGYLAGLFVGEDGELDEALRASEAGGLPAIQVSAVQGKLLHLLARSMGARKILEIGTLGGYSTIWLARALPEPGHLVSLEIDQKHAEVARRNLERAGLGDRCEVIVGPALESLPRLSAEGAGPFDLVFIDADKPSNPEYFKWALGLTRPGAMIIVDNIVRDGSVTDAASSDPAVLGVRQVNEMMAAEPRVSATALQMVGVKGWDGFSVALVL